MLFLNAAIRAASIGGWGENREGMLMVKRFGGRYVKEEEVWSVLLMALMVKGVRKSFNWSHRDELQLIKEVFGTIFSSFGVLLLLLSTCLTENPVSLMVRKTCRKYRRRGLFPSKPQVVPILCSMRQIWRRKKAVRNSTTKLHSTMFLFMYVIDRRRMVS